MRGSMQHNFAMAPSVSKPRSSFDRSHGLKTTFDAGYLIPIYVDEALPGDTINLSLTAFTRLATPIKPIMDNLYLSTFFFAVPLRLIWTNFQRFMGEQPNPGDSTDFVTPKVTSTPVTGFTVGSLYDYFGIPTGVTNLTINNFHARAYNLIWNEWFRDENLQNSLTVDKGDGPDTATNYVLQRRGKRHDYFTSALPWPQKGPAVSLPLGTQATVRTSATELITGAAAGAKWRDTGGNVPLSNLNVALSSGGMYQGGAGTPTGNPLYPTNLYADLTAATASTINQLREAITLQQLYELDARGGTRYTEIILAHFGVRSPDSRLQRPEYLGGGRNPINISPVTQMSPTPAAGVTTPQGNLAAIGTGTVRGNGFTKSFTEHCVILGLACVHADLTYQQGINRMFRRSTRFDYYWPTLANLGEQVVKVQEIYAKGIAADETAFGYQERWAEYRYKPSLVTGKFNSTVAGTLDIWHLAQNFVAQPALNAAFIVENPPVNRVIAVTSEPHFLYDSYIRMRTVRAMPVFSVPGLNRL